MPGIPYPQALAQLRASACEPATEAFDKQALLHAYHPDYRVGGQYAAAGGRESWGPLPARTDGPPAQQRAN